MKSVSQFLSWLFLPLFIPVYALAIVFYLPENVDHCFQLHCLQNLSFEGKKGLIILFGVLTAVAPGLSLIFLKSQGVIDSLQLETSKERNIPIAIMFLYSVALLVFLWTKVSDPFFPKYLFALPLSGVLVTFTFFWLNRWQKVSIHGGAVGILVGFVLAYMVGHGNLPVWPLMLTILISGMVMSARLYLKKHTLQQVLVGWGTGLFITFMINIFY